MPNKTNIEEKFVCATLILLLHNLSSTFIHKLVDKNCLAEKIMIIAFDIETVPDLDVLKFLFPERDFSSMSESEKVQALTQYHLDITDGKNSFHRQLFHRVACISAVCGKVSSERGGLFENGYEILEIKTVGREQGDNRLKCVEEKKIISDFCYGLNKMGSDPRLVTFNGKTFDIPVIKYRAMKHGISCKKIMGKNYSYRYNFDYNIDLLEAFSDFGSSARIKMSEICSVLGIPCKVDMDGSDVLGKYNSGRFLEIEDYCEIDALTTFVLLLRYQMLEGLLGTEGYNKTVLKIKTYAEENAKENILSFCKLWEKGQKMFLND